MGKYFDFATEQNTLFQAWRHVRTNGVQSKSDDTRNAIEAFDEDPIRNIRSLQSQLRREVFAFDHQTGILKTKASGKKRGIVLASVRNRIVERALLDTLQQKCSFVQDVNSCPTSVGGVPQRSVPHGLALIRDAFAQGMTHFVRSDISGFFDHISRRYVQDFFRDKISDNKFLMLIDRATEVTLQNEDRLGENRKLFPTDALGVAQGSPLSPLFGNIYLMEFDEILNTGTTVCVRFIDDFVILGRSPLEVKEAFELGDRMLKTLGLNCQNPFMEKCEAEKADCGHISSKIIFLGHQIEPGLLQPWKGARQELLNKIRAQITRGREDIAYVIQEQNSFSARMRYAQTLEIIDRIIDGWAKAFAYCDAQSTFDHLDQQIDDLISSFRTFYRKQCEGLDWRGRRRLTGVRLVGDVPRKRFDELPRMIEVDSKFVRQGSRTVSTDGSIVSPKGGHKSDAAGGWAFVEHGSDVAEAGYEKGTTIGRMELTAVVKALEFFPVGPIIIKTDSQYVSKTANGKNTARKNADLWSKFEELCRGRRVKVDWVKGHSGEIHNEQADRMANSQAISAHRAKTSLAQLRSSSPECGNARLETIDDDGESARRLASLGGSEPSGEPIPRRRSVVT